MILEYGAFLKWSEDRAFCGKTYDHQVSCWNTNYKPIKMFFWKKWGTEHHFSGKMYIESKSISPTYMKILQIAIKSSQST